MLALLVDEPDGPELEEPVDELEVFTGPRAGTVGSMRRVAKPAKSASRPPARAGPSRFPTNTCSAISARAPDSTERHPDTSEPDPLEGVTAEDLGEHPDTGEDQHEGGRERAHSAPVTVGGGYAYGSGFGALLGVADAVEGVDGAAAATGVPGEVAGSVVSVRLRNFARCQAFTPPAPPRA